MKDADSGLREDSGEIRARARKALTKGNGDIYRGRAVYKGGTLVYGNGFGFTRDYVPFLSRWWTLRDI